MSTSATSTAGSVDATVTRLLQRHDLPLEHPARARLGARLGAHATPPLANGAPSAKCGLILLSYIDSAEPIATSFPNFLDLLAEAAS